MAVKPLPPSEVLRQLLRYDAEAGKLFWLPRETSFFASSSNPKQAHRAWNSRYQGSEAFTTLNGKKSHYYGSIFNEKFFAHRVCWSIFYGHEPDAYIDHINHDGLDNRILNLRCVSHSMNMKNKKASSRNQSGSTGVFLRKDTGKWVAKVGSDMKTVSLGSFETKDEAISAREIASELLGYHQNHGQ